MLFDAHIAARTATSFEIRVRSDREDPVELSVGNICLSIPMPEFTHRGRHFFRHHVEGLSSNSPFEVSARQGTAKRVLATRTLEPLPGARRLRVGILADTHVTLQRSALDTHRPGTRRLYGLSAELLERYLSRLGAQGVEMVVLLGDLVDPCERKSLLYLRGLLDQAAVPCYPIIGNHEPWSASGEALFYELLGLPECGFYCITRPNLRMLMLSTPSPDALHPRSRQFQWLRGQLEDAGPTDDVVLFSHFSLLLHPCVHGERNDGYQLLRAHREILRLLDAFPNVRLFSAGHKNVPSRTNRGGVVHLLSPQLIQAPCAYDIVDLCDAGLVRTTYEIDEQHYAEVSRAAYEHEGPLRFGTESDRSFVHHYQAV